MPLKKQDLSRSARAGYFLSNLVLRGLIGLVTLIPYRWRVPAMGRLVRLVAPVAGIERRVRENLALACPDLTETEVKRICGEVADNAGRTVIEVYSHRPFGARARHAPISGPGLAAFERARAEGRPVILITGHFGNYDAARVKLFDMGHVVGGLYRRMANPYFNDHYVRAIARVGKPLFEQGPTGMRQMVRHLRQGGVIAIVADMHVHGGEELQFFGQPAVTSVLNAELALKYGAEVIPVYAIRQPNGLDFKIVMNAPVPHSDPMTMTQALNDDLESLVRAHMGQWFWIHRRWKPWLDRGIQPAKPGG